MNTASKTIYTALVAALVAAFGFMAGVLPAIAAVSFTALAEISAAVAAGSLGIAAWFRNASDEPEEQLAWAFIAFAAVVVVVVSLIMAWGDMNLIAKGAIIALPTVSLGYMLYMRAQ